MKNYFKISFWLIFFVVMSSFLTAAELKKIWLIDVRTPEEYEAGHLKGATNIHFREISGKIKDVTTDHGDRIEVYCAVGARAQIAKITLELKGYTNVVNLGGYEDLKKEREID